MGLRTTGLLVAAAAVALSAGVSIAAAPPTAAQKSQFVKECLRNSGGNTALCDCKAEQVMKLADEAFMDVILASMNGKPLSHDQNVPYGNYISKSNRVCAPGM